MKFLNFLDHFVLWSSLGVGLLVIQAGAFLIPGLNIYQAVLVIISGSLLGSFLLALAGYVGAWKGLPTMVLTRPIFGKKGSYLPSILNVIQLIGWAAFELWIIALSASKISQILIGFSGYGLWLIFFTVVSALLSYGGPLIVVRKWLKKIGIWLVYGAAIYLSFTLFRNFQISNVVSKSASSMSIWLGLDLVIAMPISWLPLVADYNRFAKKKSPSFWGTFLGYTFANSWFYLLGVMMVLVLKLDVSSPENLISAIMSLTGGLVALVVILVDETDNAFANIYSSAVSLQNIFPLLNRKLSVILFALVSFGLALGLKMADFFNFLLLIGSVFVPLFGVFICHYFMLYKHEKEKDFNFAGLIAWISGIVIYWKIPEIFPDLGGSIPAFLWAFTIYFLFKLTKKSS